MKNFNLKKFKQETNGKWKIEFTGIGSDGKNELHDLTFDRIPHQDLFDIMKKLKRLLALSNDLFVHRKELNLKSQDQINLEAAEIALAKMDQIVIDSMSVSGFYLKGKEDNLSVVITGKHNTYHTAVAMNSPLIKLEGDAFGFEPEVKEVVDELIHEVKLYLFDCKCSGGDLFNNAEETNEEEGGNHEDVKEETEETIEA